MKQQMIFVALLGALIVPLTLTEAPALAAPGAKPEPEACTATLEVGKKYHWVTYVNGQTHRSGYVEFTSKKFGKWHKVVHLTDRPRSKQSFWGYFNATLVSFKNKALGERWTAWMKVCEGAKISGNVYKGGKAVRQFTIDTSKVRN